MCGFVKKGFELKFKSKMSFENFVKKGNSIPSIFFGRPGPTPPGPRAPFPFSHCWASPVRSSAATTTHFSPWLNDRWGPPVIPLLQQPSSSPSNAQQQRRNYRNLAPISPTFCPTPRLSRRDRARASALRPFRLLDPTPSLSRELACTENHRW